MKKLIISSFLISTLFLAWCFQEEEEEVVLDDTPSLDTSEDVSFDEAYSYMIDSYFNTVWNISKIWDSWDYVTEEFDMDADVSSEFINWNLNLSVISNAVNDASILDLDSETEISFSLDWEMEDFGETVEANVSWVIDLITSSWKIFASLSSFDIDSQDPEIAMMSMMVDWYVWDWLLLQDMQEMEWYEDIDDISLSPSEMYEILDDMSELMKDYPFLEEVEDKGDWVFEVDLNTENVISFYQSLLDMDQFDYADISEEELELIRQAISEIDENVEFDAELSVTDDYVRLDIEELLINDEVSVTWVLWTDNGELSFSSQGTDDSLEFTYERWDSFDFSAVWYEYWEKLFELEWSFVFDYSSDSYDMSGNIEIKSDDMFTVNINMSDSVFEWESFEISEPENYTSLEELMWWMFWWMPMDQGMEQEVPGMEQEIPDELDWQIEGF